MIETNLSSVFYTCRAVCRPMMKKRGGAIVNVSSIVGVHGNWGQTNYAASKAGIIGFTKSLARELGSRGVRANVVAPGYVKTQLTDVLPEEATAAMLENTPLGPARRAEGRRGRCTLPLLRRGLVHHGRRDPRRRRTGDVVNSDNGSPMSLNGSGRRRVVITGLGAVTPLGLDPESAWTSLLAGESGAGPISQFDHADYPVHFACEVKDFDPTTWIDRKAARRMDRFTHLILAAARQAEADSKLDIAKESDRIGAAIATGIGGLRSFQECYDTLATRGPDRVNPFSIPAIIPNLGAGWVSIELGTRGPLLSECTACAASNMAIGDGTDAIRLGRADVMLCGGTEAAVCAVGIAGFGAMRALSRRNDDPERASRPFDAGRDGFVMGEAGAVLVLEELEHAKARGREDLCRGVGYGLSSDAKHITEPDPTGPVGALTMALRDAGVAPDEIDYVNAHATSTPIGDAAETKMLKLALGEENAYATPVSGTKGATGHCLGAAGAIEAMFTMLAVRDGKLPPTINYEVEDPRCDLDYVPNESRDAKVDVAVSNSFGFGGHNACVVFRAYEDQAGERVGRAG